MLFFLPILEFCIKGMSNGVQTERNLREDLSWTKRNPEDLELKSGTLRGSHEAGGRAQGVGACRIKGSQTLERFELWGACGDLNLPNLPTRDPPKPSVSSSKGQRDTTVLS